MITEKMLKEAAKEAGNAVINSLPEHTELSHEFSNEFENKMKIVLQIAKQKKRKRIFQQAACWIVVFIVSGSSLLMFNTEARATIFHWLKQQYNGFMEYRFTGGAASEQKQYVLNYIPKGYYVKEATEMEGMNIAIYQNDMGNQIAFISSSGADDISLFVSDENAQEVMVGNLKADYYQAEAEGENSVLVWYSEDRTTIFSISAAISKEEMVKVAESVEEK